MKPRGNFAKIIWDKQIENRNNRVLRTICFLDVETKPIARTNTINENVLIFGYAVVCKYYADGSRIITDDLEFKKESTFWEWFDKLFYHHPSIILVAHNCQFDMQVLHFELNLDRLGWNILTPYKSATTTIIKLVREFQSLTILDNMNWFPFSLKVLGKSIGVEKLEVDFEKASPNVIRKYCINDVMIMVSAQDRLNQFIQTEKGSEWRNTIPSMSFRLWFNSYKPKGYWAERTKEVKALERNSYHGGRVEVWKRKPKKNENVYKLDVNSMYPFVMLSEKYPSRFIGLTLNVTNSQLKRGLTQYGAIAEVVIETPEAVYPVIIDKHLVFPIGKFTTWLTTKELLYAIDHKHLLKVKKVLWYYLDDLFGNFVSHFYELRKAAKDKKDLGFDIIYKLFLNSLYGKFGQLDIHYVKEDINDNDESRPDFVLRTGENVLEQLAYFDHKRFRLISEGESPLAFTAIASHVTSNARMYLWECIKIAGIENIFYCDTDSLFVNSKGKRNLAKRIDPNELGLLKVEGVSTDAEFFVPKDYRFDSNVKRKGIRNTAKVLNENEFEQEQFLSPNGRRIKKLPEGNYTVRITKRLNRHYAVKFLNGKNEFRPPNLPDELTNLVNNFRIPKSKKVKK